MNMNHLFGRRVGRTQAKTALGLLREVRETIQAHPEAYDQHGVLCRADNGCGTTGCVGGWCAVHLFGRAGALNRRNILLDRVAKRMGLTSRQYRELFGARQAGVRDENHAARGVAHINRFIKRHYTQLRYTRLSRA